MAGLMGQSIAIILCLLMILGCGRDEKIKPNYKSSTKSQYEDLLMNKWIKTKLPYLEKVVLLSKAWLDTVNPDPWELRRYGIKGKKKLVELFEAYLAIYKFLPTAEQKSIDRRLSDIANIVQRPEYHNMALVDDQEFKEDATSYLRLCYLMQRKGFDTDVYRREIKKTLPRLNAHMITRGVNQQMSFHQYYNYFNLKEPFPLDKAYEKGIIARRWEPEAMNDTDVYGLTHEIFAIYQYGDKPDANFFLEDDKIHLKDVLKKLTAHYMETHNLDLTAELVSCMCLLKMYGEPIFKTALDYLLSNQNTDGSFGNFERLRLIYEDYVREGYYLHTTSVVVKALGLAFSQ